MFENSGEKLKIVAYIGFVVQIIALAISFIALMVKGSFLIGLLIFAIGFLVAYIDTLFIITLADAENNSSGLTSSIWELKKQIKELQDKFDTSKEDSSDTTEEKFPINQAAFTKPAGAKEMICCPKCGKTQYPGNGKCFSCGCSLK